MRYFVESAIYLFMYCFKSLIVLVGIF